LASPKFPSEHKQLALMGGRHTETFRISDRRRFESDPGHWQNS
jgi:hypothetical protein